MKQGIIKWAYQLSRGNLLFAAISFVSWVLVNAYNALKDTAIFNCGNIFDLLASSMMVSMNLSLWFAYACGIAYFLIQVFYLVLMRASLSLKQDKNSQCDMLLKAWHWLCKLCIKCIYIFFAVLLFICLLGFLFAGTPAAGTPAAGIFGVIAVYAYFFAYACGIAYFLIQVFYPVLMRAYLSLKQDKNSQCDTQAKAWHWLRKLCIKCIYVFLAAWLFICLLEFVFGSSPDAEVFEILAFLVFSFAAIVASPVCIMGVGYGLMRVFAWASPRVACLERRPCLFIKYLCYISSIAFQVLAYIYSLNN